jgi:hypothetical protein
MGVLDGDYGALERSRDAVKRCYVKCVFELRKSGQKRNGWGGHLLWKVDDADF